MKLAQQHIGPAENVHVCLVGQSGQAIVALDDRLLVLKAGFMAGATLGGKAESFPFHQITGIEMKLGPITGVLVIQTASFQGATTGSFWTRDKDRDPWKLPNCIPIVKGDAPKCQLGLDLIRERVAAGFWPDGIGSASQSHGRPPEGRAPFGQQTVPVTRRSAPVASGQGDSERQTSPNDLASQLSAITQLHLSGELSDIEFEQAKRKLLG